MPSDNTPDPARHDPLRIGIVAPGRGIDREIASRVTAFAQKHCGAARVHLQFHPQCFLSKGHFGGSDDARTAAFVEMANAPDIDAVWFARGGYGACRLDDDVVTQLGPAACAKTYLGYSDTGMLLGLLYRHRIGTVVHGPMPVDLTRADGEQAVGRALDYLVERKKAGCDPSIGDDVPVAAFNLTILSMLMGTPSEPDLSGHVVMVEEVAEYLYRIDRMLCHITAQPGMQRIAGLRLGRCSDIPENDPDFGQNEEEVVRYWCARRGLAYLGRADIGHDVDNKIVPFGVTAPASS